jgi:shikimate kinase
VGELLAQRLGVRFVDSDHEIEARTGRIIREIFAAEGEPAFRALEHQVIADLLAGPDAVLALGGGAVQHPLTRKLLADVPVVFLRITYTGAFARVGGDGGRPMLARPDINEVYNQRQAAYEEVATLDINTRSRPPEEIAAEILARLGARHWN